MTLPTGFFFFLDVYVLPNIKVLKYTYNYAGFFSMYRVDEWQGDSVHSGQLKELKLTMNLDHNKQPLPVIPCVKLTNIH